MAQFPNEANLLMVDDDEFNAVARSAAFPAGQQRNPRREGVGETGCWNGLSRGRHFPTSFGRNGHAWAGQTHLAAFHRVSRFSREHRRT